MDAPRARLLLTAPLALLLVVLALPGQAWAVEPPTDPPGGSPTQPEPSTLTLSGPAAALVDSTQQLTLMLTTGPDGAAGPRSGVELVVERRGAPDWQEIARVVTDEQGSATVSVQVGPRASGNVFRASFAGDDQSSPAQSAELTIAPRKSPSTVELTGPGRVVDETSARLDLRWRAVDGRPIKGKATVKVRLGKKKWADHGSVRFDAQGRASLRVEPRVDSRWKVVGPSGRWWARGVSAVHRLDNVPPGTPVALPGAAPRPRVKLPRQARARGAGPNAVVQRIPDGMWRSMVGRSWHAGCPVGRAQLRVVRVNYWGFDGYRYRGELVVRDAIAGKTAAVFSAIYRAQLPVRAMYRVDRFGWSPRLRGADDYRSMAADNTSAFNCRGVVGNPSRRSPHSYGRSIDVNPWENPYASSADGWVPNAWWVGRSHPRVAWRSADHPMVRIMREHGFRWTYGRSDNHHFDG